MPVSPQTQREAIVSSTSQSLRLSAAEETLIYQLDTAGAKDEAARLRVSGLPSRRVESYHYTDLRTLLRDVPAIVTKAETTNAPELRVAGSYRILMANGVVQDTTVAPAGVVVGTAKGGVLNTRDDVMVRLNAALTNEALRIDLSNSVDPVIHVDHRISGDAAHCADGVKIFVADGASAVVLESYSGGDAAHLGNHGAHVTLGVGAQLTHIMVDLSGDATRHFGAVEYEIGAEAKLHSMVIHDGAALCRTQVFARFIGEGAHADFAGVNLIDDGDHADITLDIDHSVANTSSTERFKSIARGKSRAVVQGRIVVARDAQKTDAQMMVQGLMLSDEAEILTKPELEIFADDVVCGHGATCGALDDGAMFYLMSRGIPRAEAEAILVRAFVQDMFDPIEGAELREALIGVTDEWLVRATPQAAA